MMMMLLLLLSLKQEMHQRETMRLVSCLSVRLSAGLPVCLATVLAML